MTDVTPEPPSDLGIAVVGEPAVKLPSLTRGSAARFFADASGLVFGLVSGVIAARGLGPEGKGLFSSLTLLTGIMLWVCSLGLGDAAIVMVGQGKATVQKALSVTVTAVLALSLAGMVLLWAASIVAFRNDWHEVRTAAALACFVLPLLVLGNNLGFLLSAQERVVAHSAVSGTTAVMTSVGLLLFVGLVPLSIAGGVLANGLGAGAGLVLAAWLLRRSGLSFRPRLDRQYLAVAVRYGVSVAVSYVVTIMFQRIDLLLTYALAGPGAAGQYSVALALSMLVALLPTAISAATFPRLAKMDQVEADQLTAQACRYGFAAALSAGLVLVATVPVAVPLLFGRAFAPSVGPTLILLAGGVLWSNQWLLCRAAAARGRPGLLLRSFVLGLSIMCGLDYVLIPRLGITGGALAAVAGPAAGLALCLVSYHRSRSWNVPLRSMVPRAGDFRAFVVHFLALLPFRGGGQSDKVTGG